MPAPLETRRLGASDLDVTAIGLGCMSLSGVYGASSDENGVAVVHAALDAGVNFLDSADMYGWGHNETVLAKALKGRRAGVIVASKFGQVRQEGGGNGVDGRPEYVRAACEASLKRLEIEVIDLYYIHRIDPKVAIEDTIGAMAQLVKEGKVRHIALCEANPATIRRAHQVHPLAAVQTEYSLLYREEAEETLETTRALGISFVAYSPLGRSMLTGAVRDAADVANDRRKDHPRFAAENLERNRQLVARLEALAAAKGCTPGQVALAWVLAQGKDVVAIPGTKRVERVGENIGALRVVLNAAEVAELSTAFPKGAAAGTRYPAGQMKTVFI
jgi:aryl-alcohol dehydrogenase-like predicted oxidoreductase